MVSSDLADSILMQWSAQQAIQYYLDAAVGLGEFYLNVGNSQPDRPSHVHPMVLSD